MTLLIPNGDFEDADLPLSSANTFGWVIRTNDEALSAETDAPLAGARSLKCVTPDGSSSKGVMYMVDANGAGTPVTPGQEVPYSFLIKAEGTGRLKFRAEYNWPSAENFVVLTAPGQETVTGTFTVPPPEDWVGAETFEWYPVFMTDHTVPHADLVFWLDDLVFGTPDADASGGIAPGTLLALGGFR